MKEKKKIIEEEDTKINEIKEEDKNSIAPPTPLSSKDIRANEINEKEQLVQEGKNQISQKEKTSKKKNSINFNECHIAICPNGGLIALYNWALDIVSDFNNSEVNFSIALWVIISILYIEASLHIPYNCSFSLKSNKIKYCL